MELGVDSQAEGKDKGDDGGRERRGRPVGQGKVRADCHQPQALRSGQTANRRDLIAKRGVVEVEG